MVSVHNTQIVDMMMEQEVHSRSQATLTAIVTIGYKVPVYAVLRLLHLLITTIPKSPWHFCLTLWVR